MLLNSSFFKILFLLLILLILTSCRKERCFSFEDINGKGVRAFITVVKDAQLDTLYRMGDTIGISAPGEKFCFSEIEESWFNKNLYRFSAFPYEDMSYYGFNEMPVKIIFTDKISKTKSEYQDGLFIYNEPLE